MYEQIWDRKTDVTLQEVFDEMLKYGVTHAEYIPDWVFDNNGIKSKNFHVIVIYKGKGFVCYSQWSDIETVKVNHIRKMDVIEL